MDLYWGRERSSQQIYISGSSIGKKKKVDMPASFLSSDDANRIVLVVMKYFIDHVMKNQWK